MTSTWWIRDWEWVATRVTVSARSEAAHLPAGCDRRFDVLADIEGRAPGSWVRTAIPESTRLPSE
jgi:hypothetical protein